MYRPMTEGPLEYHTGYPYARVMEGLGHGDREEFRAALDIVQQSREWLRQDKSLECFVCAFSYADVIWTNGADYVFLYPGEWESRSKSRSNPWLAILARTEALL